MASLRYKVFDNEEEIYGVFHSYAVIDGKRVSIGAAESCELKKSAVLRGFVDDNGELFPWVGWKESLIATLRDVTTAASYNHEWWSQHASKPEWVIRLETAVMKLWIHYPQSNKFAEAKEIGSKLGFYLTLLERKCGEAVSHVSFLEQWEEVEFRNNLAGIPRGNRDRTEVIFMGAKSFYAHAAGNLETTQELRKLAFQLAQEDDLQESQDFLAGYVLGSTRANSICDHNLYWQFDERQTVAETLQGYWDSVEMQPTLTEVTVLIRNHLPDETKRFLEKNSEADAAFSERTKKLFQKIGLKKGSAGRPRK